MEKKALIFAGVDRRNNSVSFDTLGQVDETENRETHRHTRVQGAPTEKTHISGAPWPYSRRQGHMSLDTPTKKVR